VVCLDETSKQLIVETRVPIEAKPGQPKRYDYEYERNGTANLFMLFAPLEGWRNVSTTLMQSVSEFRLASLTNLKLAEKPAGSKKESRLWICEQRKKER
jgi:hypothetical protein